MGFFEECAAKLKAMIVGVMILVAIGGFIWALTFGFSLMAIFWIVVTILSEIVLYAIFVFADMAQDVSYIRQKFEKASVPTKILCPSCTKEIEAKYLDGDTVKCPHCSRTFSRDELITR